MWASYQDTSGDGVLFQAMILLNVEKAYFAQFLPICLKLAYFLCTFYRPKKCGGVPKLTNIRYGPLKYDLTWGQVSPTSDEVAGDDLYVVDHSWWRDYELSVHFSLFQR